MFFYIHIKFLFSSILRCRIFVFFLRIRFFIRGYRNIRFRGRLPATWRRRRGRWWRWRIWRIWRRRWWWRWWVLMSFDDFFTDGFRGIGQLLADCIYWFLKLIKRKKNVLRIGFVKIQMLRNVKINKKTVIKWWWKQIKSAKKYAMSSKRFNLNWVK